MAERVLINKQILQDSIDAIRAKKGTTASIVVADMPTEIASISGGGGIADSTKTLVGAISGVTPTDETTLNNAIAKAYADTPTEQKWNGTRSTADGGTIKDGVAFVESIKGSTIKINQLVKDATFADSSEWQNLNANCALSIANNVASISVLNTGRVGALPNTITPIDITHTYYMSFDIKADGATSVVYSLSYYGNDFTSFTSKAVSSSWTNISGVAQPRGTANVNGRLVVQFLNTAVGAVLYLRNFVCIDLTAMGQESLTADTLASYCGYSSPSDLSKLGFIPSTNLRNFTHNSISSKTRWIPVDMGTIVWKKTTRDNTGTYFEPTTFRVSPVNAEIRCDFYEVYDGNTLYTGSSLDKGIANLTNWGTIIVRDSAYTDATAFKNAMLGKYFYYQADEATQNLDTLSLNVPSSVFPNGMNGVGTAYDEWKPSEGKAIKRIGKVDLGTLTWSKNGSTFLSFGISMPNKPYAQWNELHNILCDEYSAVSAKDAYQNNVTGVFGPTSGVSGAGINIKDVDRASTMDANEFKSAMSGKYAYYELKTSTETTTDKAKAFYKVASGGTESVSGGENSTPIKADIGYRGMSAEELVNAINI